MRNVILIDVVLMICGVSSYFTVYTSTIAALTFRYVEGAMRYV